MPGRQLQPAPSITPTPHDLTFPPSSTSYPQTTTCSSSATWNTRFLYRFPELQREHQRIKSTSSSRENLSSSSICDTFSPNRCWPPPRRCKMEKIKIKYKFIQVKCRMLQWCDLLVWFVVVVVAAESLKGLGDKCRSCASKQSRVALLTARALWLCARREVDCRQEEEEAKSGADAAADSRCAHMRARTHTGLYFCPYEDRTLT